MDTHLLLLSFVCFRIHVVLLFIFYIHALRFPLSQFRTAWLLTIHLRRSRVHESLFILITCHPFPVDIPAHGPNEKYLYTLCLYVE